MKKMLVSFEDMKYLATGGAWDWWWTHTLSWDKGYHPWFIWEWDERTKKVYDDEIFQNRFRGLMNQRLGEQPVLSYNAGDTPPKGVDNFFEGNEEVDVVYLPLDRRFGFTPNEEGRPSGYPKEAYLQPGTWAEEVYSCLICP
ncbi:MAG: hypothetical protein WC297_03745 [Candidatus Paceibacterota bacterium]